MGFSLDVHIYVGPLFFVFLNLLPAFAASVKTPQQSMLIRGLICPFHSCAEFGAKPYGCRFGAINQNCSEC